MYTISHMRHSQVNETLNIARKRGIFTAGEAAREGIHSQILTRLIRKGAIERIARGQYRYPDQPVTEHHSLAVVARAVPHGVICLISALSFHEIGTQLPPHVWLAIDRRARRPKIGYPMLRIARLSGKAFTDGIEVHQIEGQPVKIYGVAKTLADLFKYRNKIGLDVALEALREAWRDRRFTMDEMDRYARICRVQRVMKPYLEALVA
jgi:predicted transcriptional regulator of viral defense system